LDRNRKRRIKTQVSKGLTLLQATVLVYEAWAEAAIARVAGGSSAGHDCRRGFGEAGSGKEWHPG